MNKNNNVLIIGDNGSGKSTILDALCYSLFGKPFRRINKPQLVNSVNGRDCVVEIEFETNGRNYKIIRGMKPNIFQIYSDGNLINQDSASKDYQEYLENFILKMNYKSFTQIVILGSASFTPFMQLTPADRRIIIEDLLDIQIFSVMSVITKQKYQLNKEELEKNRLEDKLKQEKKVLVERTIQGLKDNNEEKLSELVKKKDSYIQDIDKLENEIDDLEKNRSNLNDDCKNINLLREKYKKLISLQSKIENNIQRHQKEIDFFENNGKCSTCTQDIDPTLKRERIDDLEDKKDEYKEGLSKISEEINTCLSSINELDKKLAQIQILGNDITSRKTKRNHLISLNNELQTSIDNLSNSDKLLIENKNELQKIMIELDDNHIQRERILDERKYLETALSLLKDGGIKTKIIKQYLPIINKQINKYLSMMNFFVTFEIDENFEETIKSRYRDIFSYENFSEGEKMRIDLALLFTWRMIAKMKNSVNTNLLILDEVFDSSLDINGTDEFLKIMRSFTNDANFFVISHRQDQLIDKFDAIYRFVKQKNFSRIM